MLGPGLQVSVGTTVYTSSGTNILQYWSDCICERSSCIAQVSLCRSLWTCMMYVSAPLRAGDEEKNECSRAEMVPKEAGVPSCLKRKVVSFGTDFTATVWTWLPTPQLVCQAFLWFHPLKFSKCQRQVCWEGPLQVVVQKVSSIFCSTAVLLISSFCCVGASSSSSGSSRRASPGRAAGPDHPAPSSPVCGEVWMSSSHAEPAPSPPETHSTKQSPPENFEPQITAEQLFFNIPDWLWTFG